ncbi:MAG: protein-L-isoaspartate O-methyltransferase [Leptospiraceae bacterium]|nr:protein-L-isoaspartate O-methyltransferase [Leptospiraceae bacterium]
MNTQWAKMIEEQLVRRGITDLRVLRAFQEVDRAPFVNPEYRSMTYDDGPLPIGYDQTISQPYIVGLMTASILPPEDSPGVALEIGAGCGYQTAILCQIFDSVIAFERVPELATRAESTLHSLGIQNFEIHSGDGSRGMPGKEFQAILGAAAFSRYPAYLEEQLAPGGKMILPAGSDAQYLYLVQRKDRIVRKKLLAVRFVPMIQS